MSPGSQGLSGSREACVGVEGARNGPTNPFQHREGPGIVLLREGPFVVRVEPIWAWDLRALAGLWGLLPAVGAECRVAGASGVPLPTIAAFCV